MTRLAEHLARSETSALISLLGSSTIELLGKLGPEATSPDGLAYFIESVHGKRAALRTKAIRDLLLFKLKKAEAVELCQLLQLPEFTPFQTLLRADFDAVPGNLELLERWYDVAADDAEAPLQVSEGSQRAVASHKLHAHQLKAFRELRRAIAQPPCSVLVHMPFGAGKLRLVATSVLDLYRSESDDRSIVWLAPGAAMCEEAFVELQEVWRHLGSRDITMLKLYGDHPARDLDKLGGTIAVIDILRLSTDDAALEVLGSITSVAVLADAESLINPVGLEIIRKMSKGGPFSSVGMLAPSGHTFAEGSARSALMEAFPDACITIATNDELESLRAMGDFTNIEGTVVRLTTVSSVSSSTGFPTALVSGRSLDFDLAYVNELSNNVERNERLLEILCRESAGGRRVVFYATTPEHARLFAGLLPVQGVKARAITSEESTAARTLALQRFVARDERVLCVHGFLLSGSSVPDISVCVMGIPCKSRAAFLSTIGRLVQARGPDLQSLRLIVAADTQVDANWVESLSNWSTLNT